MCPTSAGQYPRQGLFRADAYDQVLIDLRQSMK